MPQPIHISDTMLQDIPGTICYLHDILVTGKNNEDHFKNLEEVLKRLKNAGLRVKKPKCALMQDSVQYLGYKIDAQGPQTKLQPYKRHLLKQLRSLSNTMVNFAATSNVPIVENGSGMPNVRKLLKRPRKS